MMQTALTTLLLVASCQVWAQAPADAVAAILDDWHLAAAQADEARYFSHMDEVAVFLGTDGTERWVKPEFQKWAHPFFARGRAWSFKAVRRSVAISSEGQLAWFDEDLATPNLGPCRGSGVLLKDKGRWRIAQYNLSVPIPNALMDDVKARIAALAERTAPKP